MELTQGLTIAQRFQLVRELGRGGMGSVWLAHHVSLDVPCAVKFINAEAMDLPEIRARFEREAKAAASLRSPNVVNIIDYGVSEVGPYIAMEYLEGEDLAQRLARRGRLGPHETVEVVSNVARALTKAHAAGLVHRDLKPENVFLVRDEDREIVKVLDFGIAKVNRLAGNDGATKTGSLLGTPSYMSPEQAQGTKAVDHRSDLWSLAVLAFRCLTGRLPFVSEALGDLLVQIIVSPMPVPSSFAPDLPPSFDAWWARAAARDPAQRYQTAREAADALAASFGLAQATGPGSWEARAPAGSPPNPAGYATPAGAQPSWGHPSGPSQGAAMGAPQAYGANGPPYAGGPYAGAAPQGPYASGPSAGGAPHGPYASGPSAGGATQGPYASGPSGSAAAISGHVPAAAAAMPPTAGAPWGGAGTTGSGATGLGVAHTMGGGVSPRPRTGARAIAIVGGLALVTGVLLAAVVATRSGGGASAPAAGGPSGAPESTTASASAAGPQIEAAPTAIASAAAPAESAAAPAASATAAPRAPIGKAPPPGSVKPPAPTPPPRGRFTLPGGKDPKLGF